ncbi:MFS transporter [Lacticaseibacillus baoqingensis]|uniref:MFS transporter n=1 Tax=Lacticaseibacillus baoqingensis TaxID=2486013 RepID=A0ABW4E4X9_9LACO|nr:MFS transporter [Lacticaseibacillus baoqingensis]
MQTKISPKVVGAIIATGLMSFCGVIVETAMNITFPTLMKEFHVATNTVQWLTTLYLLVVAAMVPLSAVLKRRFRTKTLFLWAISGFIIGVGLDGAAVNFGMLLLGRGVQGLGTGIALPLMFNIILEQVPPAKIGTMMGVGTMITGVAPAIGPTFGGFVVSTWSWRYIFMFLLPVLVIALILGVVCIQQKNPTQAVAIDGLSVGLVIVTFAGLIYGISNWGTQAFFGWSVGGALGLGILAFAGFWHRSQRLAQPIINLQPLATPTFRVLVGAFVCLQISALGLSFLLPNYIQLVNGKTALVAGLIVLPGAALGALAGPLSGRWFDHVGPAWPLRLGAGLAFGGMLGLLISSGHLADGAIMGWYAVFMLGIGLSYGNIMTDGLKQLSQAAAADGNAIFNTLQQFAAAVGTSVAAALVAAGQAATKPLAAGTIVGSAHGLLVLVVLLACSVICVWLATRPNQAAARIR